MLFAQFICYFFFLVYIELNPEVNGYVTTETEFWFNCRLDTFKRLLIWLTIKLYSIQKSMKLWLINYSLKRLMRQTWSCSRWIIWMSDYNHICMGKSALFIGSLLFITLNRVWFELLTIYILSTFSYSSYKLFTNLFWSQFGFILYWLKKSWVLICTDYFCSNSVNKK